MFRNTEARYVPEHGGPICSGTRRPDMFWNTEARYVPAAAIAGPTGIAVSSKQPSMYHKQILVFDIPLQMDAGSLAEKLAERLVR